MSTDLTLQTTFDSGDLTFNGTNYHNLPLEHPLLRQSRNEPQKIDTHIRLHLYSPTLPLELEELMRSYVSTLTTPGFHGHGIRSRPRWFYANCAVFGMILGRAFALLSTPTRPPRSLDNAEDFPFVKLPPELRLQIYEHYKENLSQRQIWWGVMSRIFIKALWSGKDPEEGARYMTGIIILCCGHAMSSAPLLRGRGSKYIWWHDEIQNHEHTWSFSDLNTAIQATFFLPRFRNDVTELFAGQPVGAPQSTDGNEYVSREVLEVFDLAREHLQADERDWTPPEIEARLMRSLFVNQEARSIWENTGLVPRAFEERFAMERETADQWIRNQPGSI